MALREISPVSIVWLRFAMGVVILGIVVAVRRQFAWPKLKELPYFALLGFLAITFHQWLQALTTAQTGVFLYLEPLVVVVVAFFILGEAVTLASLLGGGIIILGSGW